MIRVQYTTSCVGEWKGISFAYAAGEVASIDPELAKDHVNAQYAIYLDTTNDGLDKTDKKTKK